MKERVTEVTRVTEMTEARKIPSLLRRRESMTFKKMDARLRRHDGTLTYVTFVTT
jgi:hypothetical protein